MGPELRIRSPLVSRKWSPGRDVRDGLKLRDREFGNVHHNDHEDTNTQDDVRSQPPISPRAVTPRPAIFQHHRAPIGGEGRRARLDSISRAEAGQPNARGTAPGTQQEGDLVEESEATEFGHGWTPVRADRLRSAGACREDNVYNGGENMREEKRVLTSCYITAFELRRHRAHPQAARSLDARPRGSLRWWRWPCWTPAHLYQHGQA